MDSAQLVRAILAGREDWVEVPGKPGRRVKVRRPAAVELRKSGVDGVALVCERVVDWEGFVEDDLLGGNGVGSSDPVPFSAAVWSAWVVDQVEVIAAVVAKLGELVDKYSASIEGARKN